jgi:hypothetical protein
MNYHHAFAGLPGQGTVGTLEPFMAIVLHLPGTCNQMLFRGL